MTKHEWKERLIELLSQEPKALGSKEIDSEQMMNYLNQLDEMSDEYWGISAEIIIAIEIHLKA